MKLHSFLKGRDYVCQRGRQAVEGFMFVMALQSRMEMRKTAWLIINYDAGIPRDL